MTEGEMFGAAERRLFWITAVMFAVVTLGVLLGVVAWALGRFVAAFSGLIVSLSIAGILALVLYPLVDFLETRFHFSRFAAIMLIMLLLAAGLVGIIFLLVPKMAEQVVDFSQALPGILEGWQTYMSRRFPTLTRLVSQRLEEGGFDSLMPELETTGRTIMSYIGLLVGLGFVPLFLYFALLYREGLRSQADELLSVFSVSTRRHVLYFVDVFVGQITAFFQGQLVIALIMGVMFATGFTLVGLEGGILIGLVLGLLNIVPYLGTLVGLLFVTPLAYFQPDGGVTLLWLSLLVFAVVQFLESWFLTPRIMARHTGLHPVLVVVAVFFWGTALGGVIGMILAVPLTAFFVAVWFQIKEGVRQKLEEGNGGVVQIYADPPT